MTGAFIMSRIVNDAKLPASILRVTKEHLSDIWRSAHVHLSGRSGRAFFRGPVGHPFAVPIDFLADMRGEFDQHASSRHSQDIHARVHDAVRELKPVFARTPRAELHQHHHDGFEAVGPEMKQIVLAKFSYADIRAPGLSLHDIGIEMAKASGEFALLRGRETTRQIKMQIGHRFLPANYPKTPIHDMTVPELRRQTFLHDRGFVKDLDEPRKPRLRSAKTFDAEMSLHCLRTHENKSAELVTPRLAEDLVNGSSHHLF